MNRFVTLLVLIATAVAIPVPQQQQIPLIPGQNGVVALVPVSALSGMSGLSATPQQQGFWPLQQLPSNFIGGGLQHLILLRPGNLPQQAGFPVTLAHQPQPISVIATSDVKVPMPVAQAPAAVQPLSVVAVPEVKVPVPVTAAPTTPKPAAPVAVVQVPTQASVPAVASTSTTVNKPGSVVAEGNTDYSFVYQVSDPVTSDSKSATETRQGDVITGSYTVNDPDGRIRIVKYTADPVNGFQADVNYKLGAPIPQTTPAPAGATKPQGMNPGAAASAQVTMGGSSYKWSSQK